MVQSAIAILGLGFLAWVHYQAIKHPDRLLRITLRMNYLTPPFLPVDWRLLAKDSPLSAVYLLGSTGSAERDASIRRSAERFTRTAGIVSGILLVVIIVFAVVSSVV
jgi:hypothetical protein